MYQEFPHVKYENIHWAPTIFCWHSMTTLFAGGTELVPSISWAHAATSPSKISSALIYLCYPKACDFEVCSVVKNVEGERSRPMIQGNLRGDESQHIFLIQPCESSLSPSLAQVSAPFLWISPPHGEVKFHKRLLYLYLSLSSCLLGESTIAVH